ncbi:unnamed protein product [Ostreobium quekettii]|uniref:Uncharacterized protein n=1 Tax=Ostreobium quekettii TaxID=121088 RepID=A0A8S1JAV2_9CHLO|nr:unnamed protein product [Ostreobium quekettii]|eukprot:evm.model.scf_99.5 EVM.evm.TU.scf_99.5   scf_99:34007-38630(-)
MAVETAMAVEAGGELWEGGGELLNKHLDEYGRTCREVACRLVAVWNDMGLDASDQGQELADVTASILGVWNSALQRADEGRAILDSQVAMARAEIARIAAQLADEDAEGESKAENVSCAPEEEDDSHDCEGKSLKAQYEALLAELEGWRGRRAERAAEFGGVLRELRRVRARLGQPLPASVPAEGQQLQDISRKHLEWLGYELSQSNIDLQRRERELEGHLSRLRKICFELGEDDVEIASSVHPTLKYYPQLLPNLSAFRPSYCAPLDPDDKMPDGVDLSVSDSTLSDLELKISEMKNVKVVRQQQALEMTDILRNLWTALDVPQNDVDRGIFTRLMEGPSRLHLKSLERCMKEVNRLEQEQAKLLLGLIAAKKSELEALCMETRLAMPDLSPLLPAEMDESSPPSCGQIADNLAKLVRMVAEVNLMAEKRVGIVKMITDLEAVLDEVMWLMEYENDRSRYHGRGRDANQKLQRALRVGKIRDKLPEKVKRLQELILAWEQGEGQPFMFDSKNYRVEVLDRVVADLERHAAREAMGPDYKPDLPTRRAASRQGSLGRSNSARCRSSMDMRGREASRDAPSRAGSCRSARSVDAVRRSEAPSRSSSVGARLTKMGRSAGSTDSQRGDLRRSASVPKTYLQRRDATPVPRTGSSSFRSTPRITPRSSSGPAPPVRNGSTTMRSRSASRDASRHVPETVPERRRISDESGRLLLRKGTAAAKGKSGASQSARAHVNAGCKTEMGEPRRGAGAGRHSRSASATALRTAYNPLQDRLNKLLQGSEPCVAAPAKLGARRPASPQLPVSSSSGEGDDRRMVSSSSSGSGGAIGVGYYKEPADGVGSWYYGKDETVGFYDKEKEGGVAEAATKPAPRKKTPRKGARKSAAKPPLKAKSPRSREGPRASARAPHWRRVFTNGCYLESPLSSDQEEVGESEDCSELTVVPDDSSYSGGHDAAEGPCAKDAFMRKDSFIAKKISHDRKDSDYLMNGRLSV